MKKFIIDLLKFTGCIMAFILIISIFNMKFSYKEDYFRLDDSIDYIVFGDSHAECTFSNSIDKFVNLGQSAEVYLYTLLKAERVLKSNPKVKTIFIDFCNSQIDESQDSFFWSSDSYLTSRYLIYSPFFKTEEYELLWNNNPNGLVDSHLKSLFSGFINIFTSTNIIDDNFMGGYQILKNELTPSVLSKLKKDKAKPKEFNLSGFNLSKLKDILYLCKLNNVNVFLVRTPLHEEWKYLKNENTFKKILSNNFSNVEFLDFKNFPILDSEFADFEHLNEKGSDKFSEFFDRLIKEGMLNVSNKQEFINLKIKEVE